MPEFLNIKIRNEAGKDGGKIADLIIDGPIGFEDWWDESGVVASKFMRQVNALGDLEEINILLNSPGGIVSDGVTITNYLRNHKAPVSVTVMGQAASIASVVAMAADPGKLHMALGTTMFVHDPLTFVGGDADDMREMADMLDKIRDAIVDVYVSRVDMPRAEIIQLMKDDTIMTAEDAVEWGFADTMDAELKAVAYDGDLKTLYAKVLNHHHKEEAEMPTPITAKSLAKDHPDLLKEIQDAARAEGATAELDRVTSVMAAGEIPGHEELIQTMAFDGKTTGADAALAIIKAEGAVRKAAAQGRAADVVKPLDQPVDNDDDNPVVAGTAAEFDQEVKALVDGGKSRGQAITAVARSHPKAHAAWIDSKNGAK